MKTYRYALNNYEFVYAWENHEKVLALDTNELVTIEHIEFFRQPAVDHGCRAIEINTLRLYCSNLNIYKALEVQLEDKKRIKPISNETNEYGTRI